MRFIVLRSISVVLSKTRLTVVLPFAVLPTVLSFSLLSAGCGDSDASDDPTASGGSTAQAGDSAGGQGTDDPDDAQNAAGGGSGAGAGAGDARAGTAGELDNPRDAGALGPAPVQLGDAAN